METEARKNKDVWHKLLLTAYRQSGEVIILLDYKGAVMHANPAAIKLFGYSESEFSQLSIENILIAQAEPGLKITIPDLLKIVEKNIQGVDKDNHAFPIAVRMSSISTTDSVYALLFISVLESRLIKDKALQRRNAEIMRLKESINHLKNNTERALRDRTQVLQETVDSLITTQKQLHHSLNEVVLANEKCSKFAYLISHEYRNPLTAILSSLNLIERYSKAENPLSKTQHLHLLKAKEHVDQLVTATEGLLQLNVCIKDGQKLQTAEVAVTDLLNEISETWSRITPEEHKVPIRLNAPGKVIVETNGNLLKQALNNLVSNAIKYSDGKGEVVIECDEDNDNCIISIKDQGRGIPKEEFHKLNNGFYRATNTNGVTGNGLGLFIVRQFLEHLNGKLELESELNLGTCATIRLPKKYEEKSIVD